MALSRCLTPGDFLQMDRGALDRGTEESMRDHLSDCKSCASAYEQHSRNATVAAPMRRLNPESAPVESGKADASSSPEARVAKHLPNIDGYRILGVLGQGGMGIVYRAVQTKLNRAVALKVLPAMIGAANPSAVARFRREATAAARLHHTNIIPIYDFGESRDAYYYAMELIQGQALNVVIGQLAGVSASNASPARLAQLLHSVTVAGNTVAIPAEPGSDEALIGSTAGINASSTGRGRPYFAQVAKWTADAAEALHYAHGQGIIHRDIKPANIILSTDGRIMIADFGLAKSTEEESVTMTGSLLGTLRYISPEQAMAKRVRVDHRTDIYSLGATLYELLTFQPAYPGTDDKEILGAIISRDPTPSRKILPLVPHELETICMKMMEKSPENRYPTARAVAEDLRRYLNDMPIVARRPGPAARVFKFVRRRKAPVVAVIAAVLLVAATGLIVREKNRRVVEQQARVEAERERQKAEIEKLVESGLQWHARKEWGAAAAEFNKVLALDKRNARALCGLAIVKKEQYNSADKPDPVLLQEALTLADDGIAVSPEYPNLWNIKGVILKIQGRLPEAVEAYKKAAELKPEEVSGWSNLGVAQALKGDVVDAEETLKRTAELARKVGACKFKVWRNLAALQLFRRNNEAIANIEQAISCDQTDPWAAMIRAQVHLLLPSLLNVPDALEDARMADRLANQKLPKAKRVRAVAHLRNREYDKAIEAARAAIELNDTASFNLLIVAVASAHLGNTASANEAYYKALAAFPEDLKLRGAYRVSSDDGVLWFDTADELLALRDEAAALLGVQGAP